MKQLLEEITNCRNISKTLNEKSETPCRKIIESQQCELKDFQLPEPWNGDIESSKILFISSNPSINRAEKYPLGNWNSEDVSDFFINRFSHDRKWVKNELYPLQFDGSYSNGWVRFWGAVRSIARVLLDTHSPTPGKDYAITEIVHCKSVSEIGVQEAMETCTDKYLDRIIKLSNAKVIICLGDKVSGIVKSKYQLDNFSKIQKKNDSGQIFLFLPHPNARKERRLDKIFTHDELTRIKNKITQPNKL